MNLNPLTAVVSAVTKAYQKHQDTKATIAKVIAAPQIIKTQGENAVQLKDKEWELIGKKLEGGTWKDEFITLVVFAPVIILILGAVIDPTQSLFESAKISIKTISSLDTDNGYGKLLWIVALAGLGIKAFKK